MALQRDMGLGHREERCMDRDNAGLWGEGFSDHGRVRERTPFLNLHFINCSNSD